MNSFYEKAGIDLYSKAVKQSICLIDGKIPVDSDLLDAAPLAEKGSGKKKSKQQSNIEERIKTMNVQILIPEVICAVALKKKVGIILF